MALAPFDTFCAEDSHRFEVRRWLLPAIALSVVFHGGLILAFQWKRVESFPILPSAPRHPVIVLWRLAEPPKFPEETEDEGKLVPKVLPPASLPIPVPLDRPIPGEPQGEPGASPASRALPMAPAAPGSERTAEPVAPTPIPASKHSAARRWQALTEGLAVKGADGGEFPVASGPMDPTMPAGGTASLSVAGRRSLDEALARLEPVAVGDAPIDMSGGALFEYNRYELRPESIEQLRKLGELIHRNPQSVFSIEGHTDAIGSPEYNQELSERRASAVKEWLVQHMSIAPERVETRGYGSSRLLVPATGTVEEQQLNRRVEIVIKGR